MKIFTGKVISKKMQKTATVAVERVVVHPMYKKRIKRIKKYQIHDEKGAEVNQIVRFTASKPFSKTKKWKIIEIVKIDNEGDGVRRISSTNGLNKKKGSTEDTEKRNTEKTESTERKIKAEMRKKRREVKK